MAEDVASNIMFPILQPGVFDEDQEKYLRAIEQLLRHFMLGTFNVAGELQVGNKIYARDTGGTVQKLFEDGEIGN